MPIGSRIRYTALGFAIFSVAALAGCHGVPSPLRNPMFRAGEVPASDAASTTKVDSLAEGSSVDSSLPPLPESPHATSALPSASSAPTPLLDAALARSEALKQALLCDVEATSSFDEDVTETVPPEADTPGLGTEPASLAESAAGLPALASVTTSASVSQTSAEADPPGTRLSTADAPAPAPEACPAAGAAAEPVPTNGEAARESNPASSEHREETGQPDRPQATQPGTVSDSRIEPEVSEPATGAVSQGSDQAGAPEPPQVESLAITDLQLCRRVLGFGNFETLDSSACKSGQAVIVYCELIGVGSRREDGMYRALLTTEVEVLPAEGDTPLWRQVLGTADDTCNRRRHDFFVNYRLTLPDTLSAGTYRLRLIQNDLIADRTATAALSFSIQP
jgi:hypothetical protein